MKREPFPIVAIGASAGGLEALEAFFEGMRDGGGMAFVVVQHLDPEHKALLPELLQRVSTMRVMQAVDRMRVEPGCVYVIPPGRDLSIEHDCLRVTEPVQARAQRLPIDLFLRALAAARRESAVAVVLSGMGSDGSVGVREIKQQGGFTLAQEPSTAGFDSMPRSAIESGQVDVIAPAGELPARILAHFERGSTRRNAAATPWIESRSRIGALDEICTLLRARTGHDFSAYKKNTLFRRIERRLMVVRLEGIEPYVDYLRKNPHELDLLFKELLIGVTGFFRDPLLWKILQAQVLPGLLASQPAGSMLRAWVVGCSSGEEAYSLAIAFNELVSGLHPHGARSLQIFGTDLDPDAIATARRGIYSPASVKELSPERLERYFIEQNGTYRIRNEIREMVVFAPHNVISDPPFTKLDLLTCRNLLIYLTTALQQELLQLFHFSLKPDGVLMLGSSESIGELSDLFAPVDDKARLFRRIGSPVRKLALSFPTRILPNKTEMLMDTTSDPAKASLQVLADQLLLQRFAPAAVLVNGGGDVIYISGRTGKYLEPAAGKANWNIHAMAREGLQNEIALALPKALRSGETVICRNLSVGTNGGAQRLDLTIHPIGEPAFMHGMAMLVFADLPPLPADAETTAGRRRKAPRNARVTELEDALASAASELQSLREEMQTSQEELKSANEELQSTNEELQSTNEELTTSKEEMQSLNEELQSANAELEFKLDELSAANNDLKNLLNSTDIATVFLDSKLCVRRFTSHATRIFKLIPGDVGRLLSDIVCDLDYPDLMADAATVLATLVISDREIATTDNRWFQVKIMPYRTVDNVIDGVVITFSDITRAKRLETDLREYAGPDGRQR